MSAHLGTQVIPLPRLAAFDGASAGFGRHETFPLRYAWLPKGFAAIRQDPRALDHEDATVELGVGKNMVHAIRHWLRATGMAELHAEGMVPTPLGERLLSEDGWDPYLEDEGTLWLLHWLLATNPPVAAAWYWFFNRYHKPVFTSQEALEALRDFARENVHRSTATRTLRQDVAVLLRMYGPARTGGRTPLEEALDSPLSTLGLVSYDPERRLYASRRSARPTLPIGIFAFAVGEVLDCANVNAMTLDELMYGRGGVPGIGSVFRLTEMDLLAKAEALAAWLPGRYSFRESEGIDQLFRIKGEEPIRALELHYQGTPQEVAS